MIANRPSPSHPNDIRYKYIIIILFYLFMVGSPPGSVFSAEGRAAPLPRLTTQVAFRNLQFDRPVALAYPDDGSNRLFIIEQHLAKIWAFPNSRNTRAKQLFLQLPDPIHRGNEEGLLGL